MMGELINGGFFTVGEAARLLQTSPQKIRGWIDGYSGTSARPILVNDVGWLDKTLAFSFANLMEMRFVEYFAHKGVRVSALRVMAEEASRLLTHPHPFATNTVFKTDGRKIFAEITKSIDDPKLYDLKAKNWAMLPIIEKSLMRDTEYNPAGDAVSWRPRVNIAPNVVIHPRLSFGQPVIGERFIPTRTLAEAWEGEGNLKNVARWFEVPEELVSEAVEFEQRLAMAA